MSFSTLPNYHLLPPLILLHRHPPPPSFNLLSHTSLLSLQTTNPPQNEDQENKHRVSARYCPLRGGRRDNDGGCGRLARRKVRVGVPEGDGVPIVRDGEGGGAEQGLLRLGGGVEGERPGLPMLHNTADPQRLQRRRQEHGRSGVAPPPVALRLQAR